MPFACIEKKNEANRRYYANHRERLAEEKRQYSKKNPDKTAAAKRDYYARNRAAIIEKSRQYHAAHPEQRKASSQKSRLANAEQRRAVSYRDNIKYKYGLGFEEYAAMHQSQGGACAICLTPESSMRQKMCVDHDHSTGKVRGLLCFHCNSAIGHMRDDTNILTAAISYLQKVRNGEH